MAVMLVVLARQAVSLLRRVLAARATTTFASNTANDYHMLRVRGLLPVQKQIWMVLLTRSHYSALTQVLRRLVMNFNWHIGLELEF